MIVSHIRILVVDDHELVRKTLCHRLEGEPGFEVAAGAATADEALHRTLEHDPDIVLMDIDLAGVTSLEVTRRITTQRPRTRIIFVSAFAHDRYIEFALRSNVHGYLTKREPLERLIEAIRTVAMGERYFSKEIRDRLVAPPAAVKGLRRAKTRGAMLTPRHRQILTLIARGRSKREIADSLGIAVKTVETHCEMLMRRLCLHDRVGLTRFAIREGFVNP